MFDLRLDLERPCRARVKNCNTSIVEYGNCEIMLTLLDVIIMGQ